ncbi:uncharacterized protein HD556DRAFT_1311927 [Suillus plorans]|uniref:Uncharacterized protein n=1 Tax=Suillus plorans TaxID=116603 RepID=A0A9P7AHW5_9AGAM|nr:uncharacterized protein HD556DRAFT_1311927 [Suillus plorans]KAG1788673.1 hypothetical protein HD556DRAFT_1311927 [Suillus plorans]
MSLPDDACLSVISSNAKDEAWPHHKYLHECDKLKNSELPRKMSSVETLVECEGGVDRVTQMMVLVRDDEHDNICMRDSIQVCKTTMGIAIRADDGPTTTSSTALGRRTRSLMVQNLSLGYGWRRRRNIAEVRLVVDGCCANGTVQRKGSDQSPKLSASSPKLGRSRRRLSHGRKEEYLSRRLFLGELDQLLIARDTRKMTQGSCSLQQARLWV